MFVRAARGEEDGEIILTRLLLAGDKTKRVALTG
jgi:hypothetical protein